MLDFGCVTGVRSNLRSCFHPHFLIITAMAGVIFCLGEPNGTMVLAIGRAEGMSVFLCLTLKLLLRFDLVRGHDLTLIFVV